MESSVRTEIDIQSNDVSSILVTTDQPPTVATSATNGGSISLICPRTGTIQATTRIQGGDLHSSGDKGQVGVSTMALFPTRNLTTSLAIAYGSSTKSRDSYGMLFTIRDGASSIHHWKCRLPEAIMSGGLIISPVTSRHVVGGGSSGTLYVWDTILNGRLIQTIPAAHYRSITCMTWSCVDPGTITCPWDCHLVTAGADGMVHAFSHTDLCESVSSRKGMTNSIQPIRTWTKHHLPVTSLVPMTGQRMASASLDGQVIVMELCSGATLATLKMGSPVESLCQLENRIYAGSVDGIIRVFDLDVLALHQTVQMGATIVATQIKRSTMALSAQDRVFGSEESLLSREKEYQTELRGHNQCVSALAVFKDSASIDGIGGGIAAEILVSGDKTGTLRVWDVRRGCCVRVIHPWSNSSAELSLDNKSHQVHGVTSILILRNFGNAATKSEEDSSQIFGGVSHDKKRKSNVVTSMICPLQKYANETVPKHDLSPTPFIEPQRCSEGIDFWNLSGDGFDFDEAMQSRSKKLARPISSAAPLQSPQQHELPHLLEIERLRKELTLVQATVTRWETVNQKLMSKLKSK